MSSYKLLNKAELTKLCNNRAIDIEECRTKRHLIERLQQQDLRGDNIVIEDDEYDRGADSRQLADHLAGSNNESVAAENRIGEEAEVERSGESDSVTALRLQLKLAQTQLELERERNRAMQSAPHVSSVDATGMTLRDIKSLLPI